MKERYLFTMGNRGCGRLFFIQQNLPCLMAENDFISVKHKAVRTIKLKEYDDIFVFYYNRLVKVFQNFKICNEELGAFTYYIEPMIKRELNSCYGSTAFVNEVVNTPLSSENDLKKWIENLQR